MALVTATAKGCPTGLVPRSLSDKGPLDLSRDGIVAIVEKLPLEFGAWQHEVSGSWLPDGGEAIAEVVTAIPLTASAAARRRAPEP
jgi:hypothetical protein